MHHFPRLGIEYLILSHVIQSISHDKRDIVQNNIIGSRNLGRLSVLKLGGGISRNLKLYYDNASNDMYFSGLSAHTFSIIFYSNGNDVFSQCIFT